jgi:hypothetical protein
MAHGLRHVRIVAELAEGPRRQGLIRLVQVSRFAHIAAEAEKSGARDVTAKARFDFRN